MMRVYVALVVMTILLAPRPASAQRLAPLLVSRPLDLPTAPIRVGQRQPFVDKKSSIVPPTYWLEGGVVGGVVIGALGEAFAAGMCESSDGCPGSRISGVVFGAALGFAVGALIGGQIPKE